MPTNKNTKKTAAIQSVQAPNYMDKLELDAIKEGIAEIESYGVSRDNPYTVLPPWKKYKAKDKAVKSGKAKVGDYILDKDGNKQRISTAAGKYQFLDWWMINGNNSYADFAGIKRNKGEKKTDYKERVKEEFLDNSEAQEAYMDKIVKEEYAPKVNYKNFRDITEKYGAANTIAMLHYNGEGKAKEFNNLVKQGKEGDFSVSGENAGLNVSTADYMSKFKTGVDNWYGDYQNKMIEDYYREGIAPQQSGNIIEQQPAPYPMEFLPEMTITPQPEQPVIASMKNGARFKKYFIGGEGEKKNIYASNTKPNTYTYAGEEVTTANTNTVIDPADLVNTVQSMEDASTYAGPRHEIYMNQGTKGPVTMDPRDAELHAEVNARKHPLYKTGIKPADKYTEEGLAIYDDYVRNTWEPLKKVSDQGYIIDGPLGDYYKHLKGEGSKILTELNTKYPEYSGNIPPEVVEKEHPEYYQYLKMLRSFDGRIERNFNLEGATEVAKSKNGSRNKKDVETYTGQEELQNKYYDLGGYNGKPIHDHNPDGSHPGSQISQGASMGQAGNYYNNMNTAAAGQNGLNAMNGTYSAQSNPFSSGGNMNFNVNSSGNMGGGYGTVWNAASPMLYDGIDEGTKEGYIKKSTLDLGGKGVETGNIYGAALGFLGGNVIGHANWGAESDLRSAKSQGDVYKNELAERDYWKNQDIIKGQQEYFDQHTQDPKRFSAHRQWYGAAPETNPLITNDGAKMAKGAKAEVKNDELLMDGNSVMKVSKNANDHEKNQPGREFTGEPFVYTNSGKPSLLNGNDKLTTIYENPNAPAGDQMMVISDNEDLLSNVMSSEEIEELQKRIMSI